MKNYGDFNSKSENDNNNNAQQQNYGSHGKYKSCASIYVYQ